MRRHVVDRLVHRSEIFEIEGNSYRLKEAKERASQRSASRKGKKARLDRQTHAFFVAGNTQRGTKFAWSQLSH